MKTLTITIFTLLSLNSFAGVDANHLCEQMVSIENQIDCEMISGFEKYDEKALNLCATHTDEIQLNDCLYITKRAQYTEKNISECRSYVGDDLNDCLAITADEDLSLWQRFIGL